jgi:hypothetical protein
MSTHKNGTIISGILGLLLLFIAFCSYPNESAVPGDVGNKMPDADINVSGEDNYGFFSAQI